MQLLQTYRPFQQLGDLGCKLHFVIPQFAEADLIFELRIFCRFSTSVKWGKIVTPPLSWYLGRGSCLHAL